MPVNTTNETDTTEENGVKEQHSGNTRLPFGLCKKYHIGLPDNATPRDAWNALRKGVGITPDQAYAELKKKDKSTQTRDTDAVVKGEHISDSNEKELQKKEYDKAVNTLLGSDRVVYSKKMTKEFIKDSLDSGDIEMSKTTVDLFNGDSFGYSDAYSKDTAYFTGANKISFHKSKNIGGEEFDSPYEKGSTFFHETWHAIDNNYGEIVDTKNMSPEQKRHLTLSETHILRSGNTFENVLLEECKSVKWGDVIKEIKEDKENALKKLGLSFEKCQKEYDAVLDKEMELRRKAGYGTSPELKAYLKSKEYNDARQNYKIATTTPSEVNRKWGDLSDVACGYTKGREQLTNMGHSSAYFKEKGARAHEAFAECAAAMATKGESYKVLKRFIPKTMAAFEEIYQDLKNGVIKSNGRPKYVP